jgi:hypothetical protein
MIGGEVASPTKVLIDYARKNPELDIKFAWMDGKMISRQQLDMISELPSRVFFTTRNSVPVLRSSFLKAVIFSTFMPLYPARTASFTLLSLS